MELPTGHHQPTAEVHEDANAMEALLREEDAARDAGSGGFAFLDDLAQLASHSGPANCFGNDCDDLLEHEMGNYVSRSSSEEQFRLESFTSTSTEPKDPEPSLDIGDPSCSSTPKPPVRERLVPQSTTPDSVRLASSDFQPVGAEVSEEKALQLRNDVKRLSPVHVSLRERTLGEVSLTSAPLSDSSSSSSSTFSLSLSSLGELEVSDPQNCPADDCQADPERCCASAASEPEPADAPEEAKERPRAPDPSRSAGSRELVIRLSRIDGGRRASQDLQEGGAAAPEAATGECCVEPASVAPGRPTVPLCPYGSNVLLGRCDAVSRSPQAAEGPRAGPEPRSIADKLHVGDEIEFSSPGQTGGLRISSPPPIFVEETSGLDGSAELLASMAADGVDGLTEAIMTRLEQARPEPFTEDSAESLALAAGVRDEVRSDGSDSGLGSEMTNEPGGSAPAPESDSESSFLDRISDDILCDKEKPMNQLEGYTPDAPKTPTLPSFRTPSKSSLKRRLTDYIEEGDEQQPGAKRMGLDGSSSCSVSMMASKKKRNIHFDAVTVYYFPRAQGFTCVPSQGGSTLGMGATHTHAERFSLSEHAAEQRRLHRARLAQIRTERAANCAAETASSSEDPSDDTDDEPSDTEELDIDSYYFLQPVPTWQRRALLRAAGVRRIDAVEKEDCKVIRASREHCGCRCKVYCDPETCACSQANVKCQVDRAGFPCGCSRDGCANSTGRIEFNPVRVRTHFIHTVMRLELEKKALHRTDEGHQDGHQQQQQHLGHQHSRLSIPLSAVLDPPPGDCGGFTGLHYDSSDGGGARNDSLDLYTIRDDCYPSNDCLGDSPQAQQQRKQMHSEFNQSFHYGSQGPNVGFQQNPYSDYQSYQSLPSTSRSPFQAQFQPVNQNPSFSHYGSYGQVSNNSNNCHQTHSLMQQQQQPQQQSNNVMYDAPFAQDEVTGTQYTNLNSIQPMNSVVQQIGKLEPFSELLSARYSYYGDCVEQQPNHHQQQQHHPHHHHGTYSTNGAKMDIDKDELAVHEQPDQLTEDDCDENFGEIIKKSMVETVSA